MKFEPGMMICWDANPKSLFGKLQEIFTRRPARDYDPHPRDGKRTHHSIVLGDFLGEPHDLDVTHIVKASPIKYGTKTRVWVYDWIDVDRKLLERVAAEQYYRLVDKPYAYLQLLYFLRRWFWENYIYKEKWWWEVFHLVTIPFGLWIVPLIKGKYVRRWNNWFPGETICSEATAWENKKIIADEMFRRGDRRMGKLIAHLVEWNSNNYHSTDAILPYELFPDIFKLVYTNDV